MESNDNRNSSGNEVVVSIKLLVDFLKSAAAAQNEEEPEGGRSEKWFYRFPPYLWKNAIHELETGVMVEVE